MIKAILFDLDGTLIDTIHSIALSGNYALSCYDLKQFEERDYINFIGEGLNEIINKIVVGNEEYKDLVMQRYQEKYVEIEIKEAKPFANMKEALVSLKEKGYILGCISNKPDANTKRLIEYYFPGLFDYVHGNSEGIIRKPNKMHMELFRDKYHLQKEEVVYVGDSIVDYEFAKNSEVKLILTTYGYLKEKDKGIEKEADYLIDSPADLLNLL